MAEHSAVIHHPIQVPRWRGALLLLVLVLAGCDRKPLRPPVVPELPRPQMSMSASAVSG